MTALVAQVVAALLAVLGLVLLSALVLRGGLPGALAAGLGNRAARRLAVVERRAVDGRSVLLLVRVDDTEYAVLATPSGPLLLDRRPGGETS